MASEKRGKIWIVFYKNAIKFSWEMICPDWEQLATIWPCDRLKARNLLSAQFLPAAFSIFFNICPNKILASSILDIFQYFSKLDSFQQHFQHTQIFKAMDPKQIAMLYLWPLGLLAYKTKIGKSIELGNQIKPCIWSTEMIQATICHKHWTVA